MLRLLRHLRARVRYRHFDAELQEELRVHEAMKREELEASGTPPAEAAAAARRALGNVTQMREGARHVWIAPWLESVGQDGRYAVRTLRRQPLHSLVAIAVLVFGIGLPATLFNLFKGILLDPWPVRDPHEVVRLWARSDGRPVGPSVDEYRVMRDHLTSMSGVAAHSTPGYPARLQVPGRAEMSLPSIWISPNFFAVLGVRTHLGTGVMGDDETAAGRAPLVISDVAWRRHFDADPDVVGREVHVSGQPFVVTGVAPASFDGIGREVHLWMPLADFGAMRPGGGIAWQGQGASVCCINVVGRLARGVSRSEAREEVQLTHARFMKGTGRDAGRVELFGTSGLSGPGGGGRGLSLIGAFAAAVTLILVLACANVGNLQLARALARKREIATRLSIGASRGRIVRQLLTECFVMAAVAGAAAIAVAALLPKVIFAVIDDELPEYIVARLVPDGSMVAFTGLLCVLACLAFALAPALHATRMRIPLGSLDRGSTTVARLPLRAIFLAAQIAACTALVTGAGLLTRAIVQTMSFDPGFTVAGIEVITPMFPAGTPMSHREETTRAALDAAEALGAGPMALAELDPFSDSPYVMHTSIPGGVRFERVMLRRVSSRFFDVLGVPLARGRMFDERTATEAVVNQAFVRVYLPEGDALGRTLHEVDPRGTFLQALTIVGVVPDVHLIGLRSVEPIIFRPASVGMFLTRGGAAERDLIRTTLAAGDPGTTITVHPLRASVRRALEPSLVGAAMAWTLGVVGLALSAVGVFGAFAYTVEERRREIGVRLALGARRRQIVRMLAATSGRAMVAGLAVGLLLSFASGPVLRSYLFGLSPLDPLAYAGVIMLLLATAALATWIPARRACNVDPAVTLRAE
jgi:predicted permease